MFVWRKLSTNHYSTTQLLANLSDDRFLRIFAGLDFSTWKFPFPSHGFGVGSLRDKGLLAPFYNCANDVYHVGIIRNHQPGFAATIAIRPIEQ